MEAANAEGPVAWFDAQTLDEPNLATVEHRLSLRHNIAIIFSHITSPKALLVLDGLDRFTEDARRNAAKLIKASRYQDVNGPWKIILTCQPEDWDATAATLLKLGVPLQGIKTENVDFPEPNQLKPVWEAFSDLRTLAYRREFRKCFEMCIC